MANKNKKAKHLMVMSMEDFLEKYSSYAEKYGEGWEDVVIENLLSEGIEIDFVEHCKSNWSGVKQ
jgi:hypothetical protein